MISQEALTTPHRHVKLTRESSQAPVATASQRRNKRFLCRRAAFHSRIALKAFVRCSLVVMPPPPRHRFPSFLPSFILASHALVADINNGNKE